jgi:hypothetical protein
MAVTSKTLARTAAATTSTTLYTQPNTTTTTVVTNILVTNTTGSTANFTLAFASVTSASSVSVGAYDTTVIDMKQVIPLLAQQQPLLALLLLLVLTSTSLEWR